MRVLKIALLPLCLLGVAWTVNTPTKDEKKLFVKTVDAQATKKTKALLTNLKEISNQYILFGHQDDLAYGVAWKEWHKKKSDVKDVCGDYPAVFGWEIGNLGRWGSGVDDEAYVNMRNWIREAYKMGGVNTISWHVDNFVTKGDSWDVGENVVAAILPGGAHHEAYKERLDLIAAFLEKLQKGFLFKHSIPIIFRPFHEHTGHWFWWGQPHCSPEEYKQLWQFTVEYLRDEKGLRHILYCYSTDVFTDKAHYLECYPGDDYVDILGLDDYHDVKPENDPTELTRRLRMLVEIAEEKGKVAAFTETGLESIPETNWWTNRLLKHIKADSVASRIAWVLVWRNDRPEHHYAPYPGHSSVPDFQGFCNDPLIILESELPNMYKR